MRYRIIKARYDEGEFEVEAWFEPTFFKRGQWSVVGGDFEFDPPTFKTVEKAEKWIEDRKKPRYRGGQVVKVIE